MKARYHRQAREELTRAVEWYQARRPGLGADLLGEIRHALSRVGQFPLLAPLWPGIPPELQIRRVVLHRFPYSLAYLVHQDAVVVLAVAHGRREPGYWLSRRYDLG